MAVTKESKLTRVIHRSDLITFLDKRRTWCVGSTGRGDEKIGDSIELEREWETNKQSLLIL